MLFIILRQPSIFRPLQPQSHQHYDDISIWSNGRLFNRMSLVIIAIMVDCLMG